MKDKEKSKKHLINEVAELRQSIAELEKSETELNRRNRELSTLYTIDRVAAQSLNLEVMLYDVLGATLKALRLEAGGIYLSESNGEMTLCMHRGFSEEFVKNVQRIKMGEGVFGSAYSKKEPIVLDVSEYPAEQFAPFIVEEGFQTLVFLPLISGGELIGAFNLATPRSVAFSPEDVGLLLTIGQQLGTTVRNAWLYEKVQRELEERKQAEEALKESEERFRSVVESAIDAIILADNSGTIISWNKSAANIFLYSEEEVIGKPLTILVPERYRDAHLTGLMRVTSSGKSNVIGKIVEMCGLRKDGTEFPIELSLATWKKEKGTFYSGIIRDITERKKTEQVLLENARLAYASKAKSEFLACMSHELRTPLNAIMGFSELLKQAVPGELNRQQERYVNHILTSSRNLLSLISDILDLSKVEAGKIDLVIEKMSVPETINEAIILIKENAVKHNVLLKKELDPQLEFIEADKARLKQVLFNLLSNAVKFSKKEEGTVTIAAKKEMDMARFSVSDTGIGIRKEDMGKLFKTFEQLDSGISRTYGGTGLGLAISKKLVEMHGGKIWAESKFGEGSTFTFLVPIESKKQ